MARQGWPRQGSHGRVYGRNTVTDRQDSHAPHSQVRARIASRGMDSRVVHWHARNITNRRTQMTEPLLDPYLLNEPPFTDYDLAAFFVWVDSAEHFEDLPPMEGVTAYDEYGVEVVQGDGTGTARVGDPGPAAHFSVDGPRLANWAMAKLAVYEAERAELAATRDETIARMNAWYAHASKDATRSIEFFEGHLKAYALHAREDSDGRTKTITTPSGKVATTATAAKVEIGDEDELIVWAKTNAPEAVKTSESILKTPLRDYVILLEVPTRLVLACSCIQEIDGGDTSLHEFVKITTVGSVGICKDDGDQLIGKWLDTRLVPVDGHGNVVTAARVEPANVTAKVTLS